MAVFKVEQTTYYTAGFHDLAAKHTETYEFANKKDAWNFFKHSIQEHHIMDFWDDIDWNDMYVETSHYAEDGATYMVLTKWEGFEQDVKLTWRDKDGKEYGSVSELVQKLPQYENCEVYTKHDRAFLETEDGAERVELHVEAIWDNEEEEMLTKHMR